MEDFGTWEHHFSSAALLGFSAFMVPEGEDAAERALLDSEEKLKLDLSFYRSWSRFAAQAKLLRYSGMTWMASCQVALRGSRLLPTTKATRLCEWVLYSLSSSRYPSVPLLRHPSFS